MVREHLTAVGSRTYGLEELRHVGSVSPRHVDLSRPGVEPVSPALASGFLSTGPPGKSPNFSFEEFTYHS